MPRLPAGATPDGIHHLAGNVFEWCRDWYGPYPTSDATDPTGPAEGTEKVVRGGSFAGVDKGDKRAIDKVPPLLAVIRLSFVR